MAQWPQLQFEFCYQRVELLKTESLGIGSYGAVCKAMCDDLPCAAKILHPTLFQFTAPGNTSVVQKFEQECRLLSAIKHPHIVQYLSTYRDPESRLPVLLMELMDESLTQFLERSHERLPYHIEVNLCHDIALALSYLHSNGIVHRDLSSNNVLLIAGSRAKVNDFGMVKLYDVNHSIANLTPLTLCPGTVAYMSPEALGEPPIYTDKLDSFSFGVLSVQIMTRQFPDPGNRFKIIEINDPRAPSGRVQVEIPEIERRRSHIHLIDPAHPLLPLALDCLKNRDRERPSCHELCGCMSTLKASPKYTESVQQSQVNTKPTQSANRESREREIQQSQQIQDLQQQLHIKDNQLQEKHQQILKLHNSLITKNDQLHTLSDLLQKKEKESQQEQQQILGLQNLLTAINDQLHMLQQQLTTKDEQLAGKEQELTGKDHQLQQKGAAIAAHHQEIQQLRQQLQSSEQLNAEFQQKLLEREEMIQDQQTQIQELQQQRQKFQLNLLDREMSQDQQRLFLQPQPRLRESQRQHQERQLACKEEELVAKDEQLNGKDDQLAGQRQEEGEASDAAASGGSIKLRWRDGGRAPCEMWGEVTAVDGGVAYFQPQGFIEPIVIAYNSANNKWSELPKCPNHGFSLAIINSLLTAIGGETPTNEVTNTLFSFTDSEWTEQFPPMPTKRWLTTAVCSGRSLVVAGGSTGYKFLSTVEVMDTESLQWSTASNLPHTLHQATATLCGDQVYILGGFNQANKYSKSVFTCSLASLLQSCQPQSLLARLKAFFTKVWQKLADTPVTLFTCASLHGKLLAVGGCDSDDKATTAIHMYNTTTNSWELISHMATPRHQCLVAVLPRDKLMVVGGYDSGTDSVEIATIV